MKFQSWQYVADDLGGNDDNDDGVTVRSFHLLVNSRTNTHTNTQITVEKQKKKRKTEVEIPIDFIQRTEFKSKSKINKMNKIVSVIEREYLVRFELKAISTMLMIFFFLNLNDKRWTQRAMQIYFILMNFFCVGSFFLIFSMFSFRS